jgi:hypothetical protein
LDLAVEARAQPRLVDFMESVGYQTLHRSIGYSNHVHLDPDVGRVDFVYVDDRTSRELFSQAQWFLGPSGLSIRVPKPEHLAAMKVLAMKNDPSRTFQDLADIRFLITLPGVDRAEIRGYFERYGLLERFREIEENL